MLRLIPQLKTGFVAVVLGLITLGTTNTATAQWVGNDSSVALPELHLADVDPMLGAPRAPRLRSWVRDLSEYLRARFKSNNLAGTFDNQNLLDDRCTNWQLQNYQASDAQDDFLESYRANDFQMVKDWKIEQLGAGHPDIATIKGLTQSDSLFQFMLAEFLTHHPMGQDVLGTDALVGNCQEISSVAMTLLCKEPRFGGFEAKLLGFTNRDHVWVVARMPDPPRTPSSGTPASNISPGWYIVDGWGPHSNFHGPMDLFQFTQVTDANIYNLYEPGSRTQSWTGALDDGYGSNAIERSSCLNPLPVYAIPTRPGRSHMTGRGPGSLSLCWGDSAHPGGAAVEAYRIEIRPSSTGPDGPWFKAYQGRARRATITEYEPLEGGRLTLLENDVQYSVRVRSKNAVGWSKPGPINSHTPEIPARTYNPPPSCD